MHLREPTPTALAEALGPAWDWVRRLASAARARGQRLFLVGGPVRDLMLGRRVVDVDLMVDGAGQAPALAREAAARWGGELLIHGAFGTARWTPAPGVQLDLATARTETYAAPAALPTVSFADAAADLARRDFRLNAMALSMPDCALLDPHDGRADLEARRLCVLHARSFHDDPTRAFRAVRYVVRYGLQLEERSRAALDAAVRDGALDALGIERVGHELARIFEEDQVGDVVRLCGRWSLLRRVHPALGTDAVLIRRLRAFEGEGALAIGARWLALAESIPESERGPRVRLVAEGGAAHTRFRRGLSRVRAAQSLRRMRRPDHAARVLDDLDSVELFALSRLAPAPATQAWLAWWAREGRACRTSVDGAALIAAGHRPGPGFGDALEAAQAAAWRGESPQAQLARALAILA